MQSEAHPAVLGWAARGLLQNGIHGRLASLGRRGRRHVGGMRACAARMGR